MKKIISFFGEASEEFTFLNQRAGEYASQLGFTYQWSPQNPFNKEEVIGLLKGADAGIIDVEPYDDSVFREIAGRTRLLIRFGVGYDKVDLKAASSRGIAIARTTGANTLGVAEMALTLILTVRRQIAAHQRCVANGQWSKQISRETSGSTVGIVGFGAIGQTLAELLNGFRCNLIAYDPFPNMERAMEKGVRMVELQELFQSADAISLHLPYLPETHHLVDAGLLSLMKPEAVLVNTSRGNIVDEQALYDVLAAKKIAGAALDVFAQEPLPLDSPLLTLDNIVLTPHISSQTLESLWCIYKMAVDIAADFFGGNTSPHILNADYKMARNMWQ